ncbi:MAG: serpin family protein [Oscillospiraceae bacterium]|jgi:serpin B|nr:serpin family protein [Oscillospiraceae bacterium]
MKRIQFAKIFVCAALLVAFALQMSGCAAFAPNTNAAQATDLTKDVKAQAVSGREADAAFSEASAQFAVKLLQNAYTDGENIMLSPLSVLTALAMTANGADGQTLAQMEAVFGLPMQELNAYLTTASKTAGDELCAANSIWIRDGFPVQPDFLQTNANYFGAGVYSAPFNEETIAAINAWVSENTKGRIDKILDSFAPNAAMCLLNALSFDATWQTPYTLEQITDGTFHAPDGAQAAQMMHSDDGLYLEDESAIGFMKQYEGGKYSFVALLPNEDISMQDYIASLRGEDLLALIASAQHATMTTQMPKFTTDSDLALKDVLVAMGIKDAFSDADADFSRMNKALYIDNVIHKTWFALDEVGTKAGAATAVIMYGRGMIIEEEWKEIILDRPFVCAVLDNQSNTFVFLGVVNSVE